MNIHILGICGTFMGSLALLARQLGHTVTGCDANVYPPMSTQLESAGISLVEGYAPKDLPAADVYIIGNAMSRGNPAVEFILERNLPYTSGPQWLGEHVLRHKWVLAVAGTHGKTTTATMLTKILDVAGLAPGYLIGGVPLDFSESARLGGTDFFVIEADEYDTAFFDKRSKFLHYHARTLILNNLEFDHADIFRDLEAIKAQFQHVIKTLPGSARILFNGNDANIIDVMSRGCWSESEAIGTDNHLHAENVSPDGARFTLVLGDERAEVEWSMSGQHNVTNALHAAAAARHVGVTLAVSAAALSAFGGVKRRMEWRGSAANVSVYDDFAHHPTAIATTLQGAKQKLCTQGERLIAVLEPRSNTMKMGCHQATLQEALALADEVYALQSTGISWNVQQALGANAHVFNNVQAIIEAIVADHRSGDQVVIMSNGAFDAIHQRLLDALAAQGNV
jgi:UDP-N-acetylmuramate: L-alanyl-gamma-D-glutamyl-meso-diaminopimelate ligase